MSPYFLRPAPMPPKHTFFPVCGLSGACLAAAGAAWLRTVPVLREVFMSGAAKVAGLLTGSPAVRADEGWALPLAAQPVIVTEACDATDFFLMAAVLLGWHFARAGKRAALLPAAVAGAVLAAVPLTVFVNALRVVVVAHAHRRVIPLLPEACDSFLHMLTGAAVFLPALIALNLILETHGRSRTPSRA